MKIAEVRGKDTRELNLDRNDLRKELFKMRFKATAEEVSNTARFREIRRSIARINTVLGERDRTERVTASASEE